VLKGHPVDGALVGACSLWLLSKGLPFFLVHYKLFEMLAIGYGKYR
jgi:hypothetical protein